MKMRKILAAAAMAGAFVGTALILTGCEIDSAENATISENAP